MKFIDTHSHYYDERFADEFDGGASGAIALAREAGCIGVINAGTNETTNAAALALAEENEGFFAAVGIHPEDCEAITSSLEDAIGKVRRFAAHPKAVAIGEIGLDYHWEIDHDIQKRYFVAQLDLARELSMPVVIHDREAHQDVFDIIRNYRDLTIVLHSFSGSAEMARQLAADGRYISFSGVVTFKNARQSVEAAAVVPSELLLTETDAPYLAPHPHRGQINTSAYIPHIINRLAEIRGCDADELAEITVENARRAFGI